MFDIAARPSYTSFIQFFESVNPLSKRKKGEERQVFPKLCGNLLKALTMHHCGSSFIIFSLGNPHLTKCAQATQNAAANPN
jgi:hypothetical protein